MTEATLALAIATFALVGVGGWYAFETRRMVDRMDRQLEASSRPTLVLSVIPWQARAAKLRIANAGPGPAFKISGRIVGTGPNHESEFRWSYSVLTSGKYEEFGFPSDPQAPGEARFRLDEVRQRLDVVRAQFVYESARGAKYELDEAIDLSQLTDDWYDSRMMATEDHPERLMPRIAKGIDSIGRTLSWIERGLASDRPGSNENRSCLSAVPAAIVEWVRRRRGRNKRQNAEMMDGILARSQVDESGGETPEDD